MTFDEILKQDYIRLPLKQELQEDDFQEFLFMKLDKFQDQVKNSETLHSDSHFKKSNFVFRFDTLIDGIKNSIKDYYNGNVYMASASLGIALAQGNFLQYLPMDSEFLEKTSFYRMRKTQGNYSLSRNELFHVPYELRGRVSSQRYSISGFPSLYLSSRVFVAWEEMKRPKIDECQVVKIENTEPFKCLDLTMNRYAGKSVHPAQQLIVSTDKFASSYDIMAWPLIASCSVKVRNSDDSFKPEYIVPQLLLQWVRMKKPEGIIGIKFSSTHIDFNNPNIDGDFYNLVIPVQENKTKGYCSNLTELFKMTAPISLTLHDISSGGAVFIRTRNEAQFRDRNGNEKIELSEGQGTIYQHSKFHDLELILRSWETKRIDTESKPYS